MIKELLFRWAMWSIDLLFEIWFHDKKINISFRLFGMIFLHALSDTRKKVKKKILICSIIHAKHVLIICLPFHWKENRYSFIFENLKIEFVQSLWINMIFYSRNRTISYTLFGNNFWNFFECFKIFKSLFAVFCNWRYIC